MKHRLLYGIIFLIGLGAISGCRQPKETQIVARIGNRFITLKDFEDDFSKDKAFQMVKTATLEVKRKHLDRMIDQQLRIIDAYRKGLERDSLIQKALRRQARLLAYWAALEKEVIGKVIPEEEIREFYRHSNREVRVRQILLKLSADPTEEEIERVRKRAERIVEELRRGADFAEMVSLYSQDQQTAKKNGDMGYIKWGEMPDEFQKVAFSLRRYEISDPIQTPRGFHIIQVTGIRNFPQKDYEKERERILQRLIRKKRKELDARYEAYYQSLTEKYQLTYYDDHIKLLAEKLYHQRSGREYPRGPSQFSRLTEEEKKLVLASYRGRRITINDLIRLVREASPSGSEIPLTNERGIRRFLEREIRLALIASEGSKRVWLNKFAYEDELNSYKEKLMLREIQRREVDRRVKMDEEAVKRYFQQHRERYKRPEKVKVQEILVSDKKLAQKLYRRVTRGEDFGKLAKKYTEREAFKDKNGILGYITKNSYGEIGKRAFQMKKGEISKPIRVGTRYSIIRVLDRKPEEYQTFEEAKSKVEFDYRRELRDKYTKAWMDEIKRHVKVRVFEEVLQKAFQDW